MSSLVLSVDGWNGDAAALEKTLDVEEGNLGVGRLVGVDIALPRILVHFHDHEARRRGACDCDAVVGAAGEIAFERSRLAVFHGTSISSLQEFFEIHGSWMVLAFAVRNNVTVLGTREMGSSYSR